MVEFLIIWGSRLDKNVKRQFFFGVLDLSFILPFTHLLGYTGHSDALPLLL